MLRLSKKTDYAIILLSHLAVNDTAISAQEMAGKYHLPLPMVANILKQLSSAKIIESRRGQQGGYRLVTASSELTIAEIIRVTDNEFSLIECVHDACNLTQWCPTRDPLMALHEQIENFMTSLTLEQVINHPKYNLRRDSNEATHLS